MRDNNGVIIGALATCEDITEHKQLKSELRQLQDNLRVLAGGRTSNLNVQALLMKLAHDFIMIRDMDNRIFYWNQSAVLGYGWSQREALGQVSYSLLKTEFLEPLENIMACLLAVDHWEGELIHHCKDGKKIFVKSHQMLTRDARGNPLSILEINRDITEEKKFEAEMTRLDRLDVIGELAASIGHEVRNPMTTVRGYLQVFRNKERYGEYQEQFDTMIEELDRANAIISEFLSLAKNKVVDLKLGNLNYVLNALLPLLQADAFRSGHIIQLEASNIPDLYIDDKEIRQPLLNLVRNSFESMQLSGKVTIKTYVESSKVVLVVQDNGTGIPDEILDKLGTPFVTTKENGTGLGLAVCYRIAHQHNAEIQVETSSEGTTFFIRFKMGKPS